MGERIEDWYVVYKWQLDQRESIILNNLVTLLQECARRFPNEISGIMFGMRVWKNALRSSTYVPYFAMLKISPSFAECDYNEFVYTTLIKELIMKLQEELEKNINYGDIRIFPIFSTLTAMKG